MNRKKKNQTSCGGIANQQSMFTWTWHNNRIVHLHSLLCLQAGKDEGLLYSWELQGGFFQWALDQKSYSYHIPSLHWAFQGSGFLGALSSSAFGFGLWSVSPKLLIASVTVKEEWESSWSYCRLWREGLISSFLERIIIQARECDPAEQFEQFLAPASQPSGEFLCVKREREVE